MLKLKKNFTCLCGSINTDLCSCVSTWFHILFGPFPQKKVVLVHSTFILVQVFFGSRTGAGLFLFLFFIVIVALASKWLFDLWGESRPCETTIIAYKWLSLMKGRKSSIYDDLLSEAGDVCECQEWLHTPRIHEYMQNRRVLLVYSIVYSSWGFFPPIVIQQSSC